MFKLTISMTLIKGTVVTNNMEMEDPEDTEDMEDMEDMVDMVDMEDTEDMNKEDIIMMNTVNAIILIPYFKILLLKFLRA